MSTSEPTALQRYRSSLIMIALGLVHGVIYLVGPAFTPATSAWEIGAMSVLMVAAVLFVAGTVGLFFKIATGRSFEWLIAWRYLRVQHKRSWSTLIVGISLLVLAGLVMAASYIYGQPPLGGLSMGPTTLQRIMRFVSLGIFALAHWVVFFGFLMLFFSLFTTISIFTVFLGLEALVAVLSMMGGFEHDLRRKILGATAHVVVTKPKKVFSDYRKVLSDVTSMKDVVAVSPYLESEVMVTSSTNLSGVLLRGIDPARIRQVTDLPAFLRRKGGSGSLKNLSHPERLAKIPESRFRPLVTVPMGKKPGENKDGDGKKKDGKPDPDDEPGAGKGKGVISSELLDVPGEVGKKVPARPIYPGIIIGAELAKNLRLYVGDDINVVSPLGSMSPAGPIPKSKPFRVAGIFFSGLYEYDNKYAFITIPAAQRFLGIGDEISGMEIKVAHLDHAGPLADRMRQKLPKAFEVKDWRERNVNLFSALKLEKLVMFIVLTFIVLVASFSIVTNLNMVVLEKMREIAALKAMGSTHWSVLKIFMFAGLYIGIVGALVGVMMGVGICTFLKQVGLPLDPEIYYISQLPVRMNPLDIAVVGLGGVFISLLATVYPSILAARLRPVDGMRRHEI